MKELLYKISNSLVMLDRQVSKNGLLTGKMGACIMLYHSGRTTGAKAYTDIADNMLEELTESFHSNMNLSFSDGLTGIRYGIGHLIEQGFAEADCEDLFADIDEKIGSGIASLHHADLTNEYPLYSAGLFLLDKFKPEHNDSTGLDVFIPDCIEACKKWADKDFKLDSKSIIYLNSVLYFLNELRNRKRFLKPAESVIAKILAAMIYLPDEKTVRENDFYITSLLLEPLRRDNQLSNEFLNKLKKLSPETGINQPKKEFDIDRIWQSLLYFRKMKTGVKKPVIEKQVDERLNSFLDYDPNVLCRELSIMGLHLINRIKSKQGNLNLYRPYQP